MYKKIAKRIWSILVHFSFPPSFGSVNIFLLFPFTQLEDDLYGVMYLEDELIVDSIIEQRNY